MSEEKTLIEPRKHSFTLEYTSLQTAVEHLTHTQLGELTAMILNYEMYGDKPQEFSDGKVEMMFQTIKNELDYKMKKYKEKCEINARNRRGEKE